MADDELVCTGWNVEAERIERLRLDAQASFRETGDSPRSLEAVRQYVNALIQTYPDDVAALLAAPERRQFQVFLGETLDFGQSVPSVHAVIGGQLAAFAAQIGIAGTGPATGQVQRAGDPVQLFSGQFIHEANDLMLKGAGTDFRFHRTYRNQVAYLGPLGASWDHAYNLWIRETGTDLLRSTGALREDRYTRHPRFGEAGFSYWVPPDGQHATLAPEGDSYTLTAPGGVRHAYRRDRTRPDVHRIRRITDRFGNALAFEHEDGRLHRVIVNHPDRVVLFGYDDEGRITAVQDFTGRRWTYGYDDFGDLVVVTTPSTDRLPSGMRSRYEYSSREATGALAHNLVRIVDSAGRTVVENQYGASGGDLSFNRVIRQRVGAGESLLEYETVANAFEHPYSEQERPAGRTTVIAPDGHWTRRVYNRLGNLLMKEEALTDGRQRRARWRYRYNRDGALIGAVTPEGCLTQYHYGRDDFLRLHRARDDEVATHNELTARRRRVFGNVLATVRRAERYRPGLLPLTAGPWGDVFPDPLRSDPGDVVVKWELETDYQQPLTVSDPRFTRSADPRAAESAAYHATLTRYVYAGPPGDPYRLPAQVRHPPTTQADGTTTPAAVETFAAHDARGRLLKYVDAAGVVTDSTYFGADDGVLEGFARSHVIDPGALAVVTAFTVSQVGIVTAIRRPRRVSEPDDTCTTTYSVDALDRVVVVESPAPLRVASRTVYDAAGLTERTERDLRDESGRPQHGGIEVHARRYDGAARLIEEELGGRDQRSRLVTRHAYDRAGRLARTTTPRGTLLTRKHDGRALEIASTRGACTPEASTRRTRYDADGRPLEVRSQEGRRTRYAYDALGRLFEVDDAAGNRRLLTYDKADNLLVERTFGRRAGGWELLRRTEYAYDERRRQIEQRRNLFRTPLLVSDADLATAHLASPGPGLVISTQRFYDAKDRVTKLVNATGAITTTEYDALGRERVVTDALGNRVEQHHDAHGNVLRVDIVEQIRDPVTNAVTGHESFSTVHRYDELDRRVLTLDGFGNATRFAYDSRDRLVRAIDAHGNVRRSRYDVYGRLVEEVHERTETGLGGGAPLRSVVCRREYDRAGNVVAFVDGEGVRTEQDFDALDRRTVTRYADGSRATEVYDGDDNLVFTRDANGTVRRRTFDAMERLLQVAVEPAAAGVEGERLALYRYDAVGGVVAEANDHCRVITRRDSLGRAIEEIWSFTSPALAGTMPQLQLRRRFDGEDGLIALQYPGGRSVAFERDPLGRVVRVGSSTSPGGVLGSPALPPAYDVARVDYRGRRRALATYHNGTSAEYAYDGVGRLLEIRHRAAAGDALRLQYLYDGSGDVRVRSDVVGGAGTAERYRYDSTAQLTNAASATGFPVFDPAIFAAPAAPPAEPLPDRQSTMDALVGPLAQVPQTARWTYDLAANRVRERSSSAAPVQYESNALNQYTDVAGRRLRYDRAGNLVSDGSRGYRYDSRQLLTGVFDLMTGARLASFLHDAEGRRVAEIRGGVTTTLLLDGLRVLEERRDGQLVSQHVYEAEDDRPLQTSRPLQDLWIHEDSVGSPRLLTDVTGGVTGRAAYDVWGARRSVSGAPMPVGFGARRYDAEAAAYDLRARAYSPALGRFLQRDPKGTAGGTNLYTYALNNPARYVDVLGTEPSEATKAVHRFAGGASGALLNVLGFIEMGVISWMDLFDVPMNEYGRMKQAAAGEWFQSLYGAVDEGRFVDWVDEGLKYRTERVEALEAQGKHFDAGMVFGETAMTAYALGRSGYGVARGGLRFGLDVRSFGLAEATKGIGYSFRYWATRYKEPTTWGGLGGVGEVRLATLRGSPYRNWSTYVAHREIGQAVFLAERAIRSGDASGHPAVARYLQFEGTRLGRAFYGTAVNRLVDNMLASSADPILSTQTIRQGAFGANAKGSTIFPDYRIAQGNQTVIDITSPGQAGKALQYPAGNILEPYTGTGRTLFGPLQPMPLGGSGRVEQPWSVGVEVGF